MESEFAKIIYAIINGIPWQPQIAKCVSRQKKRLYGTSFCFYDDTCAFKDHLRLGKMYIVEFATE
jgi:hypothetical protein